MKRLLMFFSLVLLVSAVHANSMTTIQLRNRPAVEIIPVIEPMLKPGEAISGHGFKIFLRASAQTAADVKDMVAALDGPIKTLQISVFQGSTRGLSELGLGGRIQVESGGASVSLGSGSGNNANSGGSIGFSTNRGSGSINSISTQKRLNDRPIHQVRVREGAQAYIETGKKIPFFSGVNWVTPEGVVGGVDYQDVVTGFYVLPRLHGDNVTVEISPFKNSASGGRIQTQSASTTITGRIGDWLLIGGVSEQLKRAQSSGTSRITTQSRKNESIWIKADLIQ